MSETIEALLIPVDEPPRWVTIPLADDSGLAATQSLVGGYVEAVGDHRATVFLNEEGKLFGLDRNLQATALCHRQSWIRAADWVAGPAVIAGPPGPGGETTSASHDLIAELITDLLS